MDSVDRKQLLHCGLPENINQMIRVHYETSQTLILQMLRHYLPDHTVIWHRSLKSQQRHLLILALKVNISKTKSINEWTTGITPTSASKTKRSKTSTSSATWQHCHCEGGTGLDIVAGVRKAIFWDCMQSQWRQSTNPSIPKWRVF